MKRNLLYFIYSLFPIIYLAYLIYIRLISVRMPRNIDIFTSPALIYSTIIMLFCLCLRLYFLLKTDGIIKTSESKNKYISFLQEISIHISQVFSAMITTCIRTISIYFRSYDEIMIRIVQYLYVYVPSKRFTLIIIGFNVVSKLIVIIAFLIDIFYFKQLNYFYKTLAFLLLPIIFSAIKTCVEQFYNDNIQDLVDGIDSKPIPNSEYDEFCFNPYKMVPESTPPLDVHLWLYFYPIYEIPYNLGHIEHIHHQYHINKINILFCILYIIGWSNILLCSGLFS